MLKHYICLLCMTFSRARGSHVTRNHVSSVYLTHLYRRGSLRRTLVFWIVP